MSSAIFSNLRSTDAPGGPALSSMPTTEELADFEKMMLEVFEAKKAAELPFQKIQHAFQILKSSEDFSFDDKDERLSNFLILMASLYSFQRKEKICFISPTYFYAQQAALMGRSYLKALKATKESDISIVVPGMGHFHDTVNASNVVFMHGKDFSDYLSVIWKGRKIVQIFPDVDVPVDPIKRSYCSRHDSD